jgi:hypothetical protein
MRSPSNSARAAKIPKISFPLDVVVVDVGALAGEDAQADAALREAANRRDQMLQVAAEVIQLPHI